MKRKIENQFIANYILMFVISTLIALIIVILLSFGNDVISKTLVKNNYTAEKLMMDDYSHINAKAVVENGGGVQIVDADYRIIFSEGISTFEKQDLTATEFTDFLVRSKSVGVPFSHSIAYNEAEKFWLIVTFPTSVRIDIAIVHNKDYASMDTKAVTGLIGAVLLLYLILLAISTVIYSKLTSIGVVGPLQKLRDSTRRLRDGDYSSRVDLNLDNEFGELQDTFNAMADQIEQEILLRKQSEENRKRLILDVSHDLKNPLSSIMGYSEILRNNPNLTVEERSGYAKIIFENSLRANRLITDLFDLSQMESSSFSITKSEVDICEYLRTEMGKFLPDIEKAGFGYVVDIPEREILVRIDTGQMDRVFQNLIGNALQYNPRGTEISVCVTEQDKNVIIRIMDNGTGIPTDMTEDVFLPFVRIDGARNSRTGGTGLGLSITQRIISAHGGQIHLKSSVNKGCIFTIQIPKI